MSKTTILTFNEDYFKKGDIVESVNGNYYEVIQTPGKTQYRIFFKIITLGAYQIPTVYKFKIL